MWESYVTEVTAHWPVSHVDEGEDAVEGRHEDVRHRQVQQEVVGHAPHAAVCSSLIENYM